VTQNDKNQHSADTGQWNLSHTDRTEDECRNKNVIGNPGQSFCFEFQLFSEKSPKENDPENRQDNIKENDKQLSHKNSSEEV
jgi:hypothetical protein